MTTRPDTTTRIESVVLAVIVTVVAVAAGWASFTHVHDWTMRHTPTGTPDAFGWVNAVISELVPVAAFLTIRRRRTTGMSIGYPLALLIAAATLSLAAQLAVAQPSPSGWLLSAVPALAFMALVKLVFSTPQTPAAVVAQPAAAVDTDDQAKPAGFERSLADVPAARPAGLVPVPAEAFTRLNGTTVGGGLTR
jgi:hypothetical protein